MSEAGSDLVSEKFRNFIEEGEAISSPDIALIETLNAIWKHYAILKNITKNDFEKALESFPAIWSKIKKLDSESISKYATELAAENKISVYDSIYVTQCKLNYWVLFTFDKKLLNIARSLGVKAIQV